jgi:S-adenosylmethionine:tRNA ribosyltransferase-isomerase
MKKLKYTIKSLSTVDFNYDLPEDRIAYFPVEPRDSSKLLLYKDGVVHDYRYFELNKLIPTNTFLIANDTKVVEARLIFEKSTNSKIEVFCLEPDSRYADILTAMSQKGSVYWKCLIGGAKKWKEDFLVLTHNNLELKVTKIDTSKNPSIVLFEWNDSSLAFAEILHLFGKIPLPPYIKREATKKDETGYQTVYAQKEGSVAAPTAGLHFTDELLEQLRSNAIHTHYVTLHVGAGTFIPVKSDTLGGHEMHAEFIDVSSDFITSFLDHNHTKICIGTTSLRTLETLYWMGVKAAINPDISMDEIVISQWDAYDLPQQTKLRDSYGSLLRWMKANSLNHLVLPTQLLIAPGYKIRTVDAILTNFHQPESTLLLLIYAFVGENWKKIYSHALEKNYRFLSFGDGSLLWKHEL